MIVSSGTYLAGVVGGSLAAGYAAGLTGRVSPAFRGWVSRPVMFGLVPVAGFNALWAVRIDSARLLYVPLIGISVAFSLLAASLLLAHLQRFPARTRGAYVMCSTFSNNGWTLGAFVCFTVLGETGLGLAVLYSLLVLLVYYTAGMLIGTHFERRAFPHQEVAGGILLRKWRDFLPVAAIASGGLFNLLGVQRPALMETLMPILPPVAAVPLLFVMGVTLRFKGVARWTRPVLTVCGLKLIVGPAVGVGLARLAGLGQTMQGLPIEVIYLQASCPVAIFAVLFSGLFRLNTDLANACFLATTAGYLVLLPLLIHIAGLL